MGIGDEIMAAGRAEKLAKGTNIQVCITDRTGFPRWHPIWQNNPYIIGHKKPHCLSIVDCGGARPYIQYPFTSEGHGYTGWRARDHPGRIYLTNAELEKWAPIVQRLGNYVVISPTIKTGANVNKAWPFDRYQELVRRALKVTFVQLGDGSRTLSGVIVVPTPTFRDACAVLKGAAAYVGNEGGLHHAAAALGVKGVVIFGGSPSIEATGYPLHLNLGGSNPCGRWQPCRHCAEIMNGITVDHVLKGLECQLSS